MKTHMTSQTSEVNPSPLAGVDAKRSTPLVGWGVETAGFVMAAKGEGIRCAHPPLSRKGGGEKRGGR